jgi:hypothetical protein
MIFDTVRDAGAGWTVHRELTVAGLLGIPVPEAAIHDWGRLCDELTDQVLTGTETAEELALPASILRKRPDAIAVHWSGRMVWILEFSRVNDSREDWC